MGNLCIIVNEMIVLIVFLACLFVTLIFSAMAGLSDIRRMIIPNTYSMYIIVSFMISYITLYFYGVEGVFKPILSHLMSAGLTFFVTFILFSMRVIGGGDSKFATACALWVSVKYLPIYLFFMTVIGGVLGGVALYLKRKKPYANPTEGSWVAQVQGGKDKVPYGVAIAFGTVVAFSYAGYFSPQMWSSFLAAG